MNAKLQKHAISITNQRAYISYTSAHPSSGMARAAPLRRGEQRASGPLERLVPRTARSCSTLFRISTLRAIIDRPLYDNFIRLAQLNVQMNLQTAPLYVGCLQTFQGSRPLASSPDSRLPPHTTAPPFCHISSSKPTPQLQTFFSQISQLETQRTTPNSLKDDRN